MGNSNSGDGFWQAFLNSANQTLGVAGHGVQVAQQAGLLGNQGLQDWAQPVAQNIPPATKSTGSGNAFASLLHDPVVMYGLIGLAAYLVIKG